MLDFDKILIELSKRISTGIVDLSDPIHRFELGVLLNEYTDNDTSKVILDELDTRYMIEAPASVPTPKTSTSTGFSAISKKSGRKVYFQSKKHMQMAVQAGTHTIPTSTTSVKQQVPAKKSNKPHEDKSAPDTGGGSLASQIAGGAKKDAKKKEKVEADKAKKVADKKTPKVEPALIKAVPVVITRLIKKNKGLGAVNTKHFNKSPIVTDDVLETLITSRKIKRVKTTTKLKLPIPPGFPKKYGKLIQRALTLDKVDESHPSLSMIYGPGGAGQISSQSAEVLMMLFAKTDSSEKRLTLKNDLISYVESIDKSNKPIIDKSWIDAAYLQSESLHARLKFKHPNGYVIEQVAWDNKNDVEALGLTDYKNNKGDSTDVYFRIRVANGDVYLLEDSLKKDENVFLLNTSTSEVAIFAIKKLHKKIQQEYKELSFRYNYGQLRPSEKTKIFKRLEQIKAEAESKVSPSIRSSTFKNRQLQSAMAFANSFEQYVAISEKKRVIQKIDDKALMRAFGSKKSDKDFARSAVKALTAGKFGTPEYRAKLNKLTAKSGDRYITKAAVYAAEYFSSLGNGNIKIALENHYDLAKSFQADYLVTITSDSELRDGLMEKIDESFPLGSLFEGEEQADVDSLPVFRESLTNMFKTESYDELKTHLIVRRNENGLYELVYTTSNLYEAIPIATIGVRQRGVGYDQVLSLEMKLHPVFAKRIAKSNAELGIMTPGIRKQLDKMDK